MSERREPPTSAAELLARYASGERDFRDAVLTDADLSGADPTRADLLHADLIRTDLSAAKLVFADLRSSNLRDAVLRGADLEWASFSNAALAGADLAGACFGWTALADVDLSEVAGLDDAVHVGPSAVATSTLARSRGRVAPAFLKGCGLADGEVESVRLYDPGRSPAELSDIQAEAFRLRAASPVAASSVFLSYAHADAAFVTALEMGLDAAGIRYWRDVHDMTVGRVERQIERGLSLQHVVLLVLSQHSVASDWVEWEAAKARELEKQNQRDVLCPVAIDDAWKRSAWPGPLRRQIEDYHILDFSAWRDEAAFDRQFAKLVDGLTLFYAGRS